MATNFPNSLDSFTNPVGSNNLSSPSHADQHANVNDAVEALEAKVGVDGSADTSSLEYRVTNGISDSLTVDTSTLVVDAANNRVGVGTTSPSTNLHVSSGTAGDCELRIEADTDNNDEGDVPYITFAADGGILEAVIGLNDNRFTFASGVTSNSGFDFRTGTTNFYTNGADVVAGTTSRMVINSAGQINMPNQPSFHVFGIPSGTSGTVQVFTLVDHNNGGHYSTSTGRFTAPVTGYYFFSWYGLGGSVNDVYRYYLRFNGAEWNDLHIRADTSATGGEYNDYARSITKIMYAGDYADVFFRSDGGNAHYTGGGNSYHSFSGFLIG